MVRGFFRQHARPARILVSLFFLVLLCRFTVEFTLLSGVIHIFLRYYLPGMIHELSGSEPGHWYVEPLYDDDTGWIPILRNRISIM